MVYEVRQCPICNGEAESMIQDVVEAIHAYGPVLECCEQMHPELANNLQAVCKHSIELRDSLYSLSSSLLKRATA